jgi:hypothetical protein
MTARPRQIAAAGAAALLIIVGLALGIAALRPREHAPAPTPAPSAGTTPTPAIDLLSGRSVAPARFQKDEPAVTPPPVRRPRALCRKHKKREV